MLVLGINFSHGGSCCLVRDGKLLAYIAHERLTKNKYERGISKECIKYVLKKANLKWEDIDLAAIVNWFADSYEGKELFDKSKHEISLTNDNGIEYSFEDYISFYNNVGQVAAGLFNLHIGDKTVKAFHVDHHFAHSFYSYYMSPYKECVSFSCDFSDNIANNHSVYYFNDDLKIFRPLRRGSDFFFGSYYGQICDFLSFAPSLAKAGSVMALAAYGTPSKIAEKLIYPFVFDQAVPLRNDLYLETLFDAGIKKIPDSRVFYPQLKKEGSKVDPFWLKKEDWNNDLNKNIAATAQKILENSVINFVNQLYDSVHNVTENITFSGGTFLNCTMNGRILKECKFKNYFIAPACGDDGLSIGAALFLSDKLTKNKKNELVNNELPKKEHSNREIFEGGITYTEEDIKESLTAYKDKLKGIEITKFKDEDSLCETVAKYLSETKIVGWFQNGSEAGPRSLGHRSILADPRIITVKDFINREIKHREFFRPFSPSCLKEHAAEWFDCNIESPFMLFSIKCLKPESVPAVIHIDNTSRIQTVDETNNRLYYKLIKKFYELTEVPMLLNTSFNGLDQPVIETPEDAIKMFINSKIDILVLHNYILAKENK